MKKVFYYFMAICLGKSGFPLDAQTVKLCAEDSAATQDSIDAFCFTEHDLKHHPALRGDPTNRFDVPCGFPYRITPT